MYLVLKWDSFYAVSDSGTSLAQLKKDLKNGKESVNSISLERLVYKYFIFFICKRVNLSMAEWLLLCLLLDQSIDWLLTCHWIAFNIAYEMISNIAFYKNTDFKN